MTIIWGPPLPNEPHHEPARPSAPVPPPLLGPVPEDPAVSFVDALDRIVAALESIAQTAAILSDHVAHIDEKGIKLRP